MFQSGLQFIILVQLAVCTFPQLWLSEIGAYVKPLVHAATGTLYSTTGCVHKGCGM